MPNSTSYAQLKQLTRDFIDDGTTTFDDRAIERAIIAGLETVTNARNWSWFRTDLTIQTIAPYETGTVSITKGATTVTGVGTTFTSAMVGRFIQFDNERTLYRVVTFTSTTSLEVEDPYIDTTLSGASYAVQAIVYDLPVNFKRLRDIIDVADIRTMKQIPSDQMRLLMANYAGSADTFLYAIRTQHQATGMALWMYPPPDSVESYWLTYDRFAGWRNATTGAYERSPTLDTSLVDWDANHTSLVDWDANQIGLLRKAIIMEAYDEAGSPKAGRAERKYYGALGPAMKDDEKGGGRKFMGNSGGRLPSVDSFRVSNNVQG